MLGLRDAANLLVLSHSTNTTFRATPGYAGSLSHGISGAGFTRLRAFLLPNQQCQAALKLITMQ